MADKVIGVDVGTSAVRAAEVALGARPKLLRFGQVALPPGAVVEGEVVDGPAVSEALKRLWREAGFRSRSVRVGIASARVILRIVEVPELSEDDTRSALALQLGEYVPLAPESTVFGFQPIAGPDGWAEADPASPGGADFGTEGDGSDADGGPGAEADGHERFGSVRHQRLLLAAAHREAVTPLVEAVRKAGLSVAAVDVIPAALARALEPPRPDGVGAAPVEAIVSFGAGTTLVVVAQGGTPLFARTITSVAGRLVTERIAEQLGMPLVEAERAKRLAAAGVGGPVDPARAPVLVARAAANGERGSAPPPEDRSAEVVNATGPVAADLVAEVADSLDYFSSQPTARPIDRVVLTGGGMQLAGTARLLGDRLGLPVVEADPLARLEGVPAGFEPVDLPFLAPYLPAAAGLALGGGRRRGPHIDLQPDERRTGARSSKLPLVAGVAAVIVLLAAAWWFLQRRGEIGRQEDASAAASQELSQLQAASAGVGADSTGTGAAGGDAASILRTALLTDTDWLAAGLRLDEINAPLGIELQSLQGTAAPTSGSGSGSAAASGGAATTTTTAAASAGSTASTTTTSASSPAASDASATSGTAADTAALGTLQLTGTAPDVPTVAAWLDILAKEPRFSGAWVSAVSADATTGRTQFTATVTLTGENLVPRTLREPSR